MDGPSDHIRRAQAAGGLDQLNMREQDRILTAFSHGAENIGKRVEWEHDVW